MNEQDYKYKDLKLFWTSSDNTGCGHYRGFLPSQFLGKHHKTVHFSSGFPAGNPELEEVDVVLIQRANHEHFQTWIPHMQSLGKKVIFDLDDNMWRIPASNFAHRHYPRKELDKLDAVIRLCDAVTTSTAPLQEFLQNRFPNNRVFIFPNMLPLHETIVKPVNEVVRLGWAGSYTHLGDFDHYLIKTLRNIKAKYKDQIEIHTFGFTPQFMKDFAIANEWVETPSYFARLAELNYDIGLIVASDNDFNKIKSNLKFLEYSQCKTASIAHSTYPYINTMTHGEDSFLIQKEKTDWPEYINFLIENPEKRLEMATKAHDFVNDKFTFERQDGNLLERYTELFDFIYE